MSAISQHRKRVARYLTRAFGCEGAIHRHVDEDGGHQIDVLSCADVPTPGVTSYATVGLSEATLQGRARPLTFGVEIVAACRSDVFDFPNLISTAAFHVLRDGWLCAPGSIFRQVVGMYDLSETLNDVFFVSPFLWGTDLTSAEFEPEGPAMPARRVAFVQMVPVAPSETAHCEEHGPQSLEQIFENRQIDVFDIQRDPVV